MKAFIGITVPLASLPPLIAVQERAQRTLRDLGHATPVSHGTAPFHITLVPPMPETSAVAEAAAMLGRRAGKLTLTLTGVGSFEDTVYATVEPIAPLSLLRTEAHGLLGIEPERVEFVPHVSIVRKLPPTHVGQVRAACEKEGKFPYSFEATGVSLFLHNGKGWVAHDPLPA